MNLIHPLNSSIRPGKILRMADLFCGAGGTSTGASRAVRACGYRPALTAVNHNRVAIATHKANHPDAIHLCTSLDNINPRDLFQPDELDLLLASPECTNHSNARGGKPINDQSRCTAFCVSRWAEALLPGIVIIENVAEFQKWGPLDSKGRPVKRREGELFHAWLKIFEACGYRVGYRIVKFADLGDPTTRERLIIQCVRGRRKIVWPDPTHGPADSADLFGARRPYRAARECIDWKLEGSSIFDRKKPLVVKTIRRILAGFERFAMTDDALSNAFLIPSKSGETRVRSVERPLHTVTTESRGEGLAQSFIIEHRGTRDAQIAGSARSINDPVSAVCTSGAHHSLASAFVMPHPRTNESPSRHVDEPLPTITATSADFSFATSFLVQTAHGETEAERGTGHSRRVKSVDEPMPTVCGQRGDWAKATSFLVPNFGERDGQQPRAQSLDKPMPAVTGHGAGALIATALIGQQSCATPRHVDSPAPTIATGGAIGKVDYIVTMDHQGSNGSCVRGIGEPLSSATTKARHCLLSSFLVSYYGTNCSSSVADAVPTITCKDRFAVVRPSLEIVDAPNGKFRRVTYAAWKRLILAQARKGKRMTRLFVECADGFVRMVEITHRMLQDYELALAQGFPASYRFKGNKTQKVKQIGNAVPPNGACAIVAACLTQNSNVSWLWQ